MIDEDGVVALVEGDMMCSKMEKAADKKEVISKRLSQ
jgi:hypothetical protein